MPGVRRCNVRGLLFEQVRIVFDELIEIEAGSCRFF